MFRLRQHTNDANDLLMSQLYDQASFYPTFLRDLEYCKHELIIESPFITTRRMNTLLPIFAKLRRRGVHIVVNTRDPAEHDGNYERQAADAVATMQTLGIVVLYTGGHHRKLAVIDRRIVWEGSLNILSFTDSCEIMRKITSTAIATQLLEFIAIDQHLQIGD